MGNCIFYDRYKLSLIQYHHELVNSFVLLYYSQNNFQNILLTFLREYSITVFNRLLLLLMYFFAETLQSRHSLISNRFFPKLMFCLFNFSIFTCCNEIKKYFFSTGGFQVFTGIAKIILVLLYFYLYFSLALNITEVRFRCTTYLCQEFRRLWLTILRGS